MNLKTTDRQFRKTTDQSAASDKSRQEMTTRGADIRRALETKYLACPLTNSPPTAGVYDLTNCVIQPPLTDAKADSIRNLNAAGTAMARSDTGVENDTSLLLSEGMLTQDLKVECSTWKFPKTRRLFFSEIEKSILEMTDQCDVYACDVIGGIIWHAVEREQQISKSSCKNSSSLVPVVDTPSSGAIFELLLRQSFASFLEHEKKLYDIILGIVQDCADEHVSGVALDSSDAAIAHNIDAIVSHYSTNRNKVSPFSSWGGALDKGNITKGNCFGSLSDRNQLWREYYLANVLEMQRVEVDGAVKYEGGAKKMKRGHKMAACLLKWAAAMQLSLNYESLDRGNEAEALLCFDHETKLNQHEQQPASISRNAHCYFVAEVMRLVAAKWRENSGKSAPSTPAKQRAKRSSSTVPENDAVGRTKTFKRSGSGISTASKSQGKSTKRSNSKSSAS